MRPLRMKTVRTQSQIPNQRRSLKTLTLRNNQRPSLVILFENLLNNLSVSKLIEQEFVDSSGFQIHGRGYFTQIFFSKSSFITPIR